MLVCYINVGKSRTFSFHNVLPNINVVFEGDSYLTEVTVLLWNHMSGPRIVFNQSKVRSIDKMWRQLGKPARSNLKYPLTFDWVTCESGS